MRSRAARARQPGKARAELDELGRRQVRVDVGVLRQETDALARARVLHLTPEDSGPAAGRTNEAGQHLDRGGLARAVRTQKSEDVPALDLERNALHGHDPAHEESLPEYLVESFHGNQGLAHVANSSPKFRVIRKRADAYQRSRSELAARLHRPFELRRVFGRRSPARRSGPVARTSVNAVFRSRAK